MIKKGYILKYIGDPSHIGVKGEIPLMIVTKDYVKGDSFPIKVRYLHPVMMGHFESVETTVDAYSDHAWDIGLLRIVSKGSLVPCYLPHVHSFCDEVIRDYHL